MSKITILRHVVFVCQVQHDMQDMKDGEHIQNWNLNLPRVTSDEASELLYDRSQGWIVK